MPAIVKKGKVAPVIRRAIPAPEGRTAPETARKSPAPAAAGEEAPTGLGGENLDKVRDILFGAQLRDSDRRFSRLEETLAKQVTELREESRKRLDSLEAFLKKEL